MTFVLADRVLEAVSVLGDGDIVLEGPLLGYRGFAEVLRVGDETHYTVQCADSGVWEVGVGTLEHTTLLRRDRVISSTTGERTLFPPGENKTAFIAPTSELITGAARAYSQADPPRYPREGDTWYRTTTEDYLSYREVSPNVFAWQPIAYASTDSFNLDGGYY